MKQGMNLTPAQIGRICYLLRETDMGMPAIAARMNLSRSCIVQINKRYGIRIYHGERLRWTLGPPSASTVN